MEAKRSDRVVIDELLAFVQQKLDVMDELSLEQIYTSSYSEEEILVSKKVLADTALTTIRLGTRQKDGRGKKDLLDIFRVFKQTDPDDVPTFVVRDIHKLPPVTFDHVDVTKLLKDITLMKAEIVELRSKFENSEKSVVVLKKEVELLHVNKNTAPTVSPTSAQNINVRRRGVNASISKPATPIRDPVSPQVTNRTCTHEPLKSMAGLSGDKTYAQPPSEPHHVLHQSKVDKDGFTVVEKKKRRPRPARNHRGTAPATATTTTLRAAEPMTAVYLSRFDHNTSGEDVIKYIKERCRGKIQDLSDVILSMLESTRKTNFKSFVLRLPVKYKDTFMSPEFWPPVLIVFECVCANFYIIVLRSLSETASVMVIKWYCSRKNQIILLGVVIILSILYYVSLNEDLIEQDLDITRRSSSQPTLPLSAIIAQTKNAANKRTFRTEDSFDFKNRSSIIEYIENKLQEALKEDKGSGCDIPHLDPFAKEVTAFDKDLPKVECQGRDWVKCYLHECRVVDEILATTKDIKCTYSDIIYVSDVKYVIGEPTTVSGNEVYVLSRSDHVKIKCSGTHLNSSSLNETNILPSKWIGFGIGYRNTIKRPRLGEGSGINVLIFGFDSTAKNGFIRKMPKSYKYLTEELSATVLNGYNIVGDGTPAALFPILTGKTELELPDVRKKKNNGTLDGMPFIFYKLTKHGYHTAYFEDMPGIGTFQYRFNGFKRQPADHYLRAVFLEESKNRNRPKYKNSQYCVGDTPRYKLMTNITEQFFELPGSHFGLTFIADITHDNFNMISTADDETRRFLQAFKENGHLDNTILFMMGDHGPRFDYIRNTLQGKLEERLPLMAIHLPRALTDRRPNILTNLVSNADVLTTPHDIHATILDALDMLQYRNLYKIQGADLYRGLSLFEPIPRSRSCSEAGIEPHWCTCLRWQNVSDQDPLYSKAVHGFVHFINSLTEPVRSQCSVRTLSRTFSVLRSRANKHLLAFKGARDNDGYIGKFNGATGNMVDNYQIKVSVDPGNGIYEASAIYKIKNDEFVFDVRDVSRINAYNNEPSCISATHPHLNKYCFCNIYNDIK